MARLSHSWSYALRRNPGDRHARRPAPTRGAIFAVACLCYFTSSSTRGLGQSLFDQVSSNTRQCPRLRSRSGNPSHHCHRSRVSPCSPITPNVCLMVESNSLPPGKHSPGECCLCPCDLWRWLFYSRARRPPLEGRAGADNKGTRGSDQRWPLYRLAGTISCIDRFVPTISRDRRLHSCCEIDCALSGTQVCPLRGIFSDWDTSQCHYRHRRSHYFAEGTLWNGHPREIGFTIQQLHAIPSRLCLN